MATDPTKEQEQHGGYNHEEEVKAINDRYESASKGLNDSYTKQGESVKSAYDTQIGGYDTFLGEVGKKQEELGIKSEEQEKKARAYRYIAGIGDAISGVANLVGTAHGAVNQDQYYNAPEIIQKAEASRAERKLEMDKLNARMDELRAQKSVLESTRDLKLGELEGKKAAELLSLELQRGKEIVEAGARAREEGWKQKNFEEGQRQFKETKNLQREQMAQSAKQHSEDLASRERIAEANAKARQELARLRILSDPKKQSAVLVQNIVGVRDELAQKMGYKDYNEYLRYQENSNVDDVKKRQVKKTREERASKYPEIEQMMLDLSMPEDLDATKLSSLVTASKVFADAMDKASVTIDPSTDPNL